MKKLIDYNRGDKVQVVKLYAQNELKQRLISFGLMKDAIVEILEQAPRKKNYRDKS